MRHFGESKAELRRERDEARAELEREKERFAEAWNNRAETGHSRNHSQARTDKKRTR